MFKLAKTSLLAAGLVLGLTAAAQANGYYGYQPVTSWKTVTTYVNKTVPYTVTVMKYDRYGAPYKVYENRYKTIQVPVITKVPVITNVRAGY